MKLYIPKILTWLFAFVLLLMTAYELLAQTTISSLPYSESFESGGGAWSNITGDNMDWTRKSGSTSSSSTGPSSAYSGSYYYYTEASSPNYPSKTAYFRGPIFDLTNYSSATFSFYYHMYGAAMGTLYFEVSTNGSTWTSVWSKSGNQGNSWIYGTVNLDSYAGGSLYVRYKGITGSSYTSDMSIDYITVTGVEAPSVSQVLIQNSYSEGFESSSGTWINDGVDNIDWTRKTGSTPSGNTGPTSAYEGNYYFYTEASSPNYPYKTAYLRGPDFTFASTVSSAILTFRYHMYGATMGTLALEASTDGGNNWTGIWSISGNQGNVWNQAAINLNEHLDNGISLRFLGVIGTSYTGDIAVDDLDITVGIVQTLVDPSITENYVFSVAPQTKYGVTSETNQSIQYFDGLGRPVQTVQYEASPDHEDIITSLGYDNFGRQHISYLPFEKTNNDGEYFSSFTTVSNYTTSYGSTDDDYAYSETIFEPSTLNRTEKQRAPGYHWRDGQNREVKMEYNSNIASEVKLFTVANVQSEATPSSYGANQLYKTTTWDENETSQSTSVSRVVDFTDKLGRVVCKKVFEGTSEHATYYVYDDLSNLKYVLPPMVDVSNGVSSTELDELCFQYTYDERQRMLTKKVPGADPVYMVYDKRDRLVLTQDGVQRVKTPTKEWSYTKYDQLNRPVMTGIYQSNDSHSTLQNTVMGQGGTNLYEVFGTGYTDGYSNNSFPTSGIAKVLTVSYYDNYDFLTMSGFDGQFDFDANNGINNDPKHTSPKGMVTGGKTRMLNDNTWLRSSIYYDNKLHAIQSIAETFEGKYGKTFTDYDFTGNATETKTIYTLDDDSEEQIAERFEYDHVKRLINSWHSVDGQQEILLAKNEYDEIGRLIDKKLHSTDGGSTFDQSVDYRYNIRGWLTSINNAGRTNDGTLNNDSDDLFGMELSYQSSPSGLTFSTQYNGNISGMRWSNEQYDGTQKSYSFAYDGMNRLNDAFYKEMTASTWTVNNGYFDAYNIAYDKNGNIETLMRKDNNTIIDNLGYTYINGGNKLRAVNDITTNTGGFNDREEAATEYEYDANGNMTRDYNKEIQSIGYNIMNLPELITFEDGNKIEYYYDAAGIKWRKKVTDGGNSTETDYVGNMIFEDDNLKLMHTAEGRIAVSQVGGVNDYKYQYTLKDHLGNSRVTFGATEKEYLATMESELGNEEEAQFNKIAEYREQNFMYNHTAGGEFTPDESLMLNSNLLVDGERRIAGAMKGLKVQAGDLVDMEVWAKHSSTCSSNEITATTFLFSALTSGFGLVASGETNQAFQAFSSLLGATTLFDQTPCDVPKAYLNYIFFDENYANPITNFKQISSAAEDNFEQLSHSFSAPSAGYLYIYVSNESNLNVNVYFDDLKITHSSNLSIVQADDYYPFGLTFNEYQNQDEQTNNFLFQGQELQTDLDLGWYSFKWRNHQPDIGRFFNIDPLADKYVHNSPYAFSENKVTSHVELEGLEAVRAPRSTSRGAGGNAVSMRRTVSQAASIPRRRNGFATLARRQGNMFKVKTVHSTSRGNGTASSGVSSSAGTTSNPDHTHTFGNRSGNAAKLAAQILDGANSIVKVESFSEAGAADVSLGSDYQVNNQEVTAELQGLQNEWQAGIGETARGDLSPEEFSNLSPEEQTKRISLATAISAPSPLSQVEQMAQDADIVSEKREEETVIRATSY